MQRRTEVALADLRRLNALCKNHAATPSEIVRVLTKSQEALLDATNAALEATAAVEKLLAEDKA